MSDFLITAEIDGQTITETVTAPSIEGKLYLLAGGSGGGGAVDSVNGHTGVVVLTKSDLSLGNVDNTADASKPVSTAQAAADSAATAAAQATSLQKASNLSDLASASAARTNLGLGGSATLAVGTTTGTVAAGDDSRITGAAQKASNLSDLANAATARANLGLGTLATQSGTFSGTSSGTNTGDQDLSGLVPKTYTVNGNALSGNITVTFAQIGSLPTTLSGFGITDGITSSAVAAGYVSLTGSYSNPTWLAGIQWARVGSTPTTLSGYGITDAQPLDTELTALAGLTSAADSFPYFTGSGTAALFTINATKRTAISNLSGTNTGDQTTVSGNAGTATALQTARTINGVSFDGTANITVPAPAKNILHAVWN